MKSAKLRYRLMATIEIKTDGMIQPLESKLGALSVLTGGLAQYLAYFARNYPNCRDLHGIRPQKRPPRKARR